jgi:phosphoenolpyruvate carboxylase
MRERVEGGAHSAPTIIQKRKALRVEHIAREKERERDRKKKKSYILRRYTINGVVVGVRNSGRPRTINETD